MCTADAPCHRTAAFVRTKEFFRNLIESNWNQIVFIIFRSFWTKLTSVWSQSNRKMIDTFGFQFDSIRFRKDFSVSGYSSYIACTIVTPVLFASLSILLASLPPSPLPTKVTPPQATLNPLSLLPAPLLYSTTERQKNTVQTQLQIGSHIALKVRDIKRSMSILFGIIQITFHKYRTIIFLIDRKLSSNPFMVR